MEGFVTINLNAWMHECQLCGKEAIIDHCVPFCCDPTYDEIGSMSTVYRGLKVGGMSCCRSCHDSHEAGRPKSRKEEG